jgi:hypothetical protein
MKVSRAGLSFLAATGVGAALLAGPVRAQDAGWHGQAQVPHYKEQVFPPWSQGTNTDVTDKGFEFTVPEVNSVADFHGDITDPLLVLYIAGNYYFARRLSGRAEECSGADRRRNAHRQTRNLCHQ